MTVEFILRPQSKSFPKLLIHARVLQRSANVKHLKVSVSVGMTTLTFRFRMLSPGGSTAYFFKLSSGTLNFMASMFKYLLQRTVYGWKS